MAIGAISTVIFTIAPAAQTSDAPISSAARGPRRPARFARRASHRPATGKHMERKSV